MRHLAPCLALLVVTVSLAQDSRPSLRYGDSRTSTGFVDTPRGRVAVDHGVSWQGVKVWLSLGRDLVATDVATGTTLWDEPVGAFWNEIGFVELETAPRVKSWTVELRPDLRTREGADLRQYHDLRTGKRIAVREPLPSGSQLTIAVARHGRDCAIDESARRIIASDADWKAFVVDRMFAGLAPPKTPAIDFTNTVALVIAAGKTMNCQGIDILGAWEDGERILVRVDELTFQTVGPDGGGQTVRPWGIFMLPRRDPFKLVIVERNAQNLIGGPPIWKELARFVAPGTPVQARQAETR